MKWFKDSPEIEQNQTEITLESKENDLEIIRRDIEDSEKEWNTQRHYSEETEHKLEKAGAICINELITEENEEKARIAAQLLAKLFARPGYFLGERIDSLTEKGFSPVTWEQWGSEQKSTGPKDKEDIIAERINLLYREIFAYYGLNPSEMVTAWRESIFPMEKPQEEDLKPDGQKELILQNLHALRAIELRSPGIARFLAEESGVMNFGRYPVELLIDQYDGKDDLEHPYGIVVTARRDYNGSFFKEQEQSTLRDLFYDLSGEKYRLRIVESGGKFSLVRSLIRFDQRYGESQKISFAIIRH